MVLEGIGFEKRNAVRWRKEKKGEDVRTKEERRLWRVTRGHDRGSASFAST
jgi:hypothetical protein